MENENKRKCRSFRFCSFKLLVSLTNDTKSQGIYKDVFDEELTLFMCYLKLLDEFFFFFFFFWIDGFC